MLCRRCVAQITAAAPDQTQTAHTFHTFPRNKHLSKNEVSKSSYCGKWFYKAVHMNNAQILSTAPPLCLQHQNTTVLVASSTTPWQPLFATKRVLSAPYGGLNCWTSCQRHQRLLRICMVYMYWRWHNRCIQHRFGITTALRKSVKCIQLIKYLSCIQSETATLTKFLNAGGPHWPAEAQQLPCSTPCQIEGRAPVSDCSLVLHSLIYMSTKTRTPFWALAKPFHPNYMLI